MRNREIIYRILNALESAFGQEDVSLKQVIRALNDAEELRETYRILVTCLAFLSIILRDDSLSCPICKLMKSPETTKKEFAAKYALSLDDVETIVLSSQKTTHKEIADELKIITVDGVVARLRKIFLKTGTSNRIELAVLAAKEDLI